jgi:hypothetical protein
MVASPNGRRRDPLRLFTRRSQVDHRAVTGARGAVESVRLTPTLEKRMRTTLALAAAATALLMAIAAPAIARDNNAFSPSADPLTVAVFGDTPYGTSPTDTSQFEATPAFVDSINSDPNVRLVLNIGDIHSGKQYCTQAYDQSVFDLWTRFEDPLVYTPGDNEWADCHKAAEGGNVFVNGQPVDYANGNPVANLALVRSIFFPQTGQALGQRDKRVLSQAEVADPAHPTDANYVENVIWEQSRVLFVTINVPGGSNNDNDVWYGAAAQTQAQQDEIAQRTGADLRWLDQAFAIARADSRIKGVVIGAQADMWDPEKGAAHQTAYEPLVSSIASNTAAFGKPVLMFNGDSHVYQSGNPLAPGDANYNIHPGYNVPNFHRVVVHGSTTPLEWLRLKIDPRADHPAGASAFGPFSWERVIQP